VGHLSHRRQRALTKTAARIALILGIVAFAAAVIHFSYNAYESTPCYTGDAGGGLSQESRGMRPVDSGDCRLILASSEEHQRIDAAIAVLAIIVVIGGSVRLSNASRRTRRVVLIAEVIVVAVGIVYAVLLTSAFR
jgi:hypothetical protein